MAGAASASAARRQWGWRRGRRLDPTHQPHRRGRTLRKGLVGVGDVRDDAWLERVDLRVAQTPNTPQALSVTRREQRAPPRAPPEQRPQRRGRGRRCAQVVEPRRARRGERWRRPEEQLASKPQRIPKVAACRHMRPQPLEGGSIDDEDGPPPACDANFSAIVQDRKKEQLRQGRVIGQHWLDSEPYLRPFAEQAAK